MGDIEKVQMMVDDRHFEYDPLGGGVHESNTEPRGVPVGGEQTGDAIRVHTADANAWNR